MTRLPRCLGLLALVGVMAGLATTATAQTAGDLDCKACVGAGDLARSSVKRSRIKSRAVSFDKLSRAAQRRITDLERQVADLTALVQSMQSLAGLAPFVSVVDVTRDVGGVPTNLPTVRFEAVNVQVVNGTGQTQPADQTGPDGPNGLGNLIIGYDEVRVGGSESCSWGAFDQQGACEAVNGIWALAHKSGTHSLVVGEGHNYSQSSNVVFGSFNRVNGIEASATGGQSNTASGSNASVSGGRGNLASGPDSSVSGGRFNTASNSSASVSGGQNNEASSGQSSVSGGVDNEASGLQSSVSGGRFNVASGVRASILGGISITEPGMDLTSPPTP